MNQTTLDHIDDAFNEAVSAPVSTLLSIPTEHGLVHGELTLQPDAPGIVVLVHDAKTLDRRDSVLAARLRHAGLSTFSVDLLSAQEEHFPDVHFNVALLARRLIDFLGLLKHRMQLGELGMQPIGLCATNATSPVAVRVAALRDHDIAAIVCRGGLIDLAGVLYLRTLESPILLLIEETDDLHTTSNRRALEEVVCRKELRIIPEIGIDYAISAGFERSAGEASEWFLQHFKQQATAAPE